MVMGASCPHSKLVEWQSMLKHPRRFCKQEYLTSCATCLLATHSECDDWIVMDCLFSNFFSGGSIGLGMPGVTQTSFQTATCATQPVIQNRKIMQHCIVTDSWLFAPPCTLAKDPSSGIGRWNYQVRVQDVEEVL